MGATMSMKYLGAYLMSVIGGKDSPTSDDIKSILDAGGIAYEQNMIDMVIERMAGKTVHEMISDGYEKFAACGGGGGGGGAVAAAGGGGGADAAPAAKEEKKVVEEEEEEDMDFDLF